jgi:hypothetical protein
MNKRRKKLTIGKSNEVVLTVGKGFCIFFDVTGEDKEEALNKA